MRIRVMTCTSEGSEDEQAISASLRNMLERCLAEEATGNVAHRPRW